MVIKFHEEDISDKPASITHKKIMTEDAIEDIDIFRKKQILTLVSTDRAIEKIVAKLEEEGELDNTVIIFLSDNGKHWGEHRLDSKGSAYEESIRVPFALRYPPLVPKPYVEDRLVGSVDIAPTLYDLAKIPIPENIDGLSMVPLLTGGEWRDEMFLECWPSRGHWTAIHTGRYKYIETDGHISEFYDLKEDPYELENQINNSEYEEIIVELQTTLQKEKQ